MDGFGTLAPAADDDEALIRSQMPPDIDWSRLNRPTGEARTASLSPTEHVASGIQSALMAGGAQPYMAGHLARGLTGLAGGLTPAAPFMSAADTLYYANRGDIPGAAMSAAGVLPGLTPEARAVKSLYEASGREAAAAAAPAARMTYGSWQDALEGRRNGVTTEGTGPASGSVQAPGADVSGGAGGVGGDPRDAEAYRQANAAAGNYSPLPGLPTKPVTIPTEDGTGIRMVPGPNARAKDVAAAYLREHPELQTYPPVDRYHPIDPVHSKAIAQAYEDMVHAPNDPAVRASFEAMYKETADQYDAIMRHHPEMQFHQMPQGYDPYAKNPRLVAKDVAENNRMFFYPTEQGFGTSPQEGIDIAAHPAMRPSGYTLANGTPLLNNDLFRIVHDYFGHIKEGYGFRAAGEDNAWRSHAAMYSDLARPAMTSETRGQNSWVNYGPYAEHNKTASGADTKYADQKMGLMPDWTMQDRVK